MNGIQLNIYYKHIKKLSAPFLTSTNLQLTKNPKIVKTPKQYSIQHQYYHALNDPKPSNKFSALEREKFPDFSHRPQTKAISSFNCLSFDQLLYVYTAYPSPNIP